MTTALLDALDAKSTPSSLISGPALDSAPPLFQDMLDRILETSMPRFEKLAGANMTVICSLLSLTTETAGEILAGIDQTAVMALCDVPDLSSRILVSLDDAMLQLIIELMCGGICSEPPPAVRRAGTSIDRQFARVVFNLIASTIEKECASFGVGAVVFDQIQAKLDPTALGKRNSKVSVVTMAIECLGRRATFRLHFPSVITDCFKQDSLPSSNQAKAADPAWTERLKAEISRASVKLDAYLNADLMTLGAVADLEIGQILPLPKLAPAQCELRCNDKLLFRGELGQADGRYSLRVAETLSRKTETEPAEAPEPASLFDLS